MGLRERQRRNRRDLAWYAAGFVVVQLGLAVGIDRFWPAVRDPDYDEIERTLRSRLAEAPGRPLVLVLGSSRTRLALRADRLNSAGDAAAPLIVNAGADRNCMMMQQVFLRRLLAAGIRPELVFVEVMPLALSVRDGVPVEESILSPGRLTGAEAARLWRYYTEKHRLYRRWLTARLLPIDHHQAELRDALALDVPADDTCPKDRDWIMKSVAAKDRDYLTRVTTQGWANALTQPAASPGAVRALRDMVNLCRAEHLPAIFVIPPENSGFRTFAPAVAEVQMNLVRSLAAELAVPIIDTRTWVDDDGFYDGHHATEGGAEQYTKRFRREALLPTLAAHPNWASALSSARVRP